MSRQLVIAEIILSAARSIQRADNTINIELSDLSKVMRHLENWIGAAGTAAQTAVYQILNYNEARSTVMQNYINMLEQQVNPGYQEAESTNQSLAEQFR